MEVSPGNVRSRIEKIVADVAELESDLAGPISKGAVGYIEARHEVVEASDALTRAIEVLDENYSRAT